MACPRTWGLLEPGTPEPLAHHSGVGGDRGTTRPARPQDQRPRRGGSWPARREAWRPAMPAAPAEGQPVALSLAEKAVCKVVYGAPRPRPLLLPVGLELWLYVEKMRRHLQRKRCRGPGGRPGGQGAVGGSWGQWRGRGLPALDAGRCLSRGPPHVTGARVRPPHQSVIRDGHAGHLISVPPSPGPSRTRNLLRGGGDARL